MDWLISWVVFNTNFSSISAISWREQILLLLLGVGGRGMKSCAKLMKYLNYIRHFTIQLEY
jgi:hypothetical protein